MNFIQKTPCMRQDAATTMSESVASVSSPTAPTASFFRLLARSSCCAREALAGLPCNVHNGMQFPPEACRTTLDGWPQAARYPADHPCRDTADLAAWPRYTEKIAALRAMFRRLDQQGVALVALEEVSGATAVQPLLPAGWSVATTRELRGTPAIAQHVGVAWRRGIAVRDIEAVNTLVDSGIPERPLRPGLAFTVLVAGKPVRALVVHLKAGCRSRDLDAPLTPEDAALPDERQDRSRPTAQCCATSCRHSRAGSMRMPAPTSRSSAISIAHCARARGRIGNGIE